MRLKHLFKKQHELLAESFKIRAQLNFENQTNEDLMWDLGHIQGQLDQIRDEIDYYEQRV